MNYSSSLTQAYKCGYIHSAYINGNEVIRAQVDPYAYVIQVRSIHAAKLMISKHLNSGRALIVKRGAK